MRSGKRPSAAAEPPNSPRMNAAPTSSAASRSAPGIVAIVVAYAAERDSLAIVDQVGPFVDRVILVDNTPRGHPLVGQRATAANITMIANANRGGLAGAYNTAIARVAADHPTATHVLFLDDDTDTGAVEPFLTSAVVQALAIAVDVAAVAPTYVDRATGIRLAPIQLSRYRWRVLPRDLAQPVDVTFLINSMSLWRV